MAYKEQKCKVCEGSGKVVKGDLKVQCNICNGTGTAYGDCSSCGSYLFEDGLCSRCGKRDPNAPSSPSSGGSSAGKNISVLIVAESTLMRNLFGKMIEESGMVIAEKAMNCEYALNKIVKYNPSVILLDLEIPGLVVLDFIEECNRRGANIPIIALAPASGGEDLLRKALLCGAKNYVKKPNVSHFENVNPVKEDLVQKIRAAVK